MRKCLICGAEGNWYCPACRKLKDQIDRKYESMPLFGIRDVGPLIGRGRKLRKPGGHGYSGGDNAVPVGR